jgi:hypothetical protein
MRLAFAVSWMLVAVIVVRTSQGQPASAPATASAASTQPVLDQAALEREFEQAMTNAVLVGYSTDTRKPNATPRAERYTLQRVTKLADGGDKWMFAAQIPLGQRHVAVPLMIPVKWAGDTPVITVTNMSIPGFGTYTARVMIYGDQYAGTWVGRECGGQLWGRIERAPATTTAPAK